MPDLSGCYPNAVVATITFPDSITDDDIKVLQDDLLPLLRLRKAEMTLSLVEINTSTLRPIPRS